MKGRVLVVAGSDSGGGAGIQADIKTVTALGGYAATAVTALTAQNTEGVFGIEVLPSAFVARQMEVVLDDIGADVVKTGMLHSTPVIESVADVLRRKAQGVPLVIDPVMVAKGGHSLLDIDAVAALKRDLIVMASVITPNVPEAERLSGIEIHTLDDMKHAATTLLTLGCTAVLLKGGHLDAPEIHDLLATDGGMDVFTSRRIDTRHTHGTGCTLASAVAVGLAQGMELREAVGRARRYVHRAIATAPGFGRGYGPLNHSHPFEGAAG